MIKVFIMNKIIFLKNNTESKICFYFLKKHEGSQYNDYYCLRYNKYCTDNKRYRQEITNMISDFGDCDNFYYRICEDIYLLNDSEVSNKEVIEQTEKYIHKYTIEFELGEEEEFTKFSQRQIIKFKDKDFTKFKELCEIFAKKIAEKNGDLTTLEHDYKNNYVQYACDVNFEKYCINTHMPRFERFSDNINDYNINDYFTLEEAKAKNLKCIKFSYILADEIENMLYRKGIKEMFTEECAFT